MAGFAGGWVVHYSISKMDQQMLAQFRSGEAIQTIWFKLDLQEREKLNSVYFDKKNKK